ncbi:MAG: GIY-YIG nuclease family protein [Candidatus Gastranaerophilales bacterium]|nr:GIY-YIG nuclease family protein [Candidatus Gastranaerophilales bacterium]
MATRGKSINLFLMEGSPTGRIKVTLANWTGIAYKIPRTELEKCKELDILKQSGVYFLFGTSDDTGESIVYIGQAGVRKNGEGILYRLQEHKRTPDKDYWTEAVVFTTSNNSFGPTEISYLENRFVKLSLEAKRYAVKNCNDPTPGNITEEKESELEEFIDYAKIVMGTLGHKIFEKLISSPIPSVDCTLPEVVSSVLFELKQGKIDAKGQRTSDGFVVLKESRIKMQIAPSCPKHAKKAHEQYASTIEPDGTLLADILLRSPAEAACFVTGTSINAREAWKTSDGRTLNEVESSEVSETGI